MLAAYNFDEDAIEPMGFGYDGRTLLVGCYDGQPTKGIYIYDLEEKKIKSLGFRHAEADARAVLFSKRKRSLAGVEYDTERPEVCWFDPDFKKMQASVDLALPTTLNTFVSLSRDGTKAVVRASSDRTPGTFYFLDTVNLKMEKLFDLAEWIHADDMAEMKPIEYVARDGLKIHGYLTLPKGSKGKNLPMIVNPHGGPQVRDTWGFDPEVQFFANRGYAVLRMNFRGSPGYGKAFLEAGYKQWGLKQQDDITDGVKWAIAEGIADPKRICIYGKGYGGFAALTGLEQTPELYRCGISYSGITEIIRTLKKAIPDLEITKMVAAETVGDPKKEKERLKATSPLNHVDRIQVPVLLAYGKLDPMVPIGTGQDLASALKKRGKLYDFMVKDEEQLGFHKEENRIEFYQKVDEFLKATMQ
jgi:dipeptidyl aminopeptidase/acylaminoacyl peptidase